MTDGIDIGAIDKKARTAGYGDGLLEIFAAIVLTTLALGWIANPSFVGILSAFVVLYGWKVFERVKERVTYPRVGYYKERSEDSKDVSRGMLLYIGGAFVLMAVAVLLWGDLTDPSEWRRAAPLVSGLTLSGGFWYAGSRSGLLRYRLISGWSIVSGVLLWWSGTGDSYGTIVVHLIGLAIPLAVIGIWSLRRFMRTHPISDHDG